METAKWKITVYFDDSVPHEVEALDAHNDGSYLILPKPDGSVIGYNNHEVSSFEMLPLTEDDDDS